MKPILKTRSARPKDRAFCTIIAKNYLAQARVLTESLQKAHPGADVYVLLVDEIEDYFDPTLEKFKLIEVSKLRSMLPPLESFAFQYELLEFATSVKPFFLEYLLKTYGLRKLIYLDPDILVFNPLQKVFALLSTHSFVLTPHLTKPLTGPNRPSEQDILMSGSYNLGFIAVNNGLESRELLHWWQKRLARNCVVDLARGHFVDQRCMDLAPGLFGPAAILREPGYNVAYWNLHERKLSAVRGGYLCNREPLYFFHFSGFNPNQPHHISRHQSRYEMAGVAPADEVFGLYARLLKKEGYDECSQWRCVFDRFSNGITVSPIMRKIFRNLGEASARFLHPFSSDGASSFFGWLIDNSNGSLPPLIQEMRNARPDVIRAFPAPEGEDRLAVLEWASKTGWQEFQLDQKLGVLISLILGAEKHDPLALAETLAKGAAPGENTIGANLVGHFESEIGMGTASRGDSLCLKTAKVPIAINNVRDRLSYNLEKLPSENAFTTKNPYAVNLIRLNADMIPQLISQRGMRFFENHYNVGLWVWELERFPTRWQSSFQPFQEIWAPSRFVQESISRLSPIPVLRMPHCVQFDANGLDLSVLRKKIAATDEFVFLYMFDFLSFSARKNPKGVIQAFLKAFSKKEMSKVRLVIKCSHSEVAPSDFAELKEMAKSGKIEILSGVYDRQTVQSLLAACDCYVSLHRSEGFGLTMAEAMAAGKPTIATAYSANLDYMTPFNSYLVPYRLQELDRDHGPYRKGYHWADPDLDAAAAYMRHVFKNRSEGRRVGLEGRKTIQTQFSPEAVGHLYRERLEHIWKRLGLSLSSPPPPFAGRSAEPRSLQI